MDQVVTGTVHGNSILLDERLAVPDGQTVEVVVRHPPGQPHPDRGDADAAEGPPPTWWTSEDDRILQEIYEARKFNTRPQAME